MVGWQHKLNGREFAGQEATVRTGHGTTDWFQIGKGVCQGCILSPCLFTFTTTPHDQQCILCIYKLSLDFPGGPGAAAA